MATQGLGGASSAGAGGGSFSAWFQEAEKSAKAGKDPLTAAGGSTSSNSAASATDYLSGWMKNWTQADVGQQNDDLEAGDLLSKPTATTATTGTDDYSLSRTERFRWFVSLLGLGVFFFVISFFFLGMVIVMPGKFAFSFTLGSISFMSAFILLQGFKSWASEVFKRERLPFTISYFGSIFGTLFATLYLRSYIAIVFFSAMQISALGWYFATYVPGGQHGMRVISAIVRNTCMTCFKGCRLCIGV